MEEYYANPNFAIYQEVANKFGFIIDGNAPWRLIANINSPRMHEHMFYRSGPQPGPWCEGWRPNIFQTSLYKRTALLDLDLLKRHMMLMYNSIARNNPRSLNHTLDLKCDSGNPTAPGRLKIVDKSRYLITMGSVEDALSDFYWVSLCFKLRLIEEGVPFSEDYVSQTTREAFAIGKGNQNTVDFTKVMLYLDAQVKQRYFASRG